MLSNSFGCDGISFVLVISTMVINCLSSIGTMIVFFVGFYQMYSFKDIEKRIKLLFIGIIFVLVIENICQTIRAFDYAQCPSKCLSYFIIVD